MSRLSENLKKFFTEKIIDLLMVLALLAVLFSLIINAARLGFNKWGIMIIVILLVVVWWLMNRWIGDQFTKWKVPQLKDKRKLLKYDTLYVVVLAIVLYTLFYFFTGQHSGPLIGLFAGIIIIKEATKWYKHRRGDNSDT